MATTNLSTFFGGSTPIGGIQPVTHAYDTTGTNFLKADGSDVAAASYPDIASRLPASITSSMRCLPNTAVVKGVAFGNGIFVGLYTTTLTAMAVSLDGVNWYANPTFTFATNTTAIAFLNGAFYLATGNAGLGTTILIHKSINGLSWTTITTTANTPASGETGMPAQFSYQNGIYFLSFTGTVLNDGLVYHYLTSTDGITWTVRAFQNNLHKQGTQIAYGASTYVSVAGGGQTCSSTDFINWTIRTNTPTGGGGWSSVCFGSGPSVNGGNGAFVSAQGWTGAGTSFGYSTNGTSWTQQTVPSGRYFKVIYANSLFVAIGWNVCATSVDGLTWNARTVPTSNWSDVTYSAVYGFVAVSLSDYRSIQSSDGITWNTFGMVSNTPFGGVTWGSGLGFMVVPQANTPSFTSTDGLTWTRNSNMSYNGAQQVITDGTTYVSVPTINGGSANYYSTTDATTWTLRGTTISGVGYAPSFGRYLNDKFVIFSNSASATLTHHSYNGTTWFVSTQNNGTFYGGMGVGGQANLYFPNAAAYGNGVYVATTFFYDTPNAVVGTTKAIYTSPDGIFWTINHSLPAAALWSDVAFGNGVFVAISKHRIDSGSGAETRFTFPAAATYGVLWNNENFTTGKLAAVSTNGIDWYPATLPVTAIWTSISFDGSVFIAVAEDSSTVAISKDGYSWNVRQLPVNGDWIDIASNNTGTSVVVPKFIPYAAATITKSGTNVMLPHIEKERGIDFTVRVK